MDFTPPHRSSVQRFFWFSLISFVVVFWWRLSSRSFWNREAAGSAGEFMPPLPPNPCLSSLLVQAHLRLISAILISWGFCASGGYPNPFVLFCLVELTSEHICGIQAQIIRGFVRNPRPESGEQHTWIPPLIGCLSPNPTEIDACVCDFSSPAWSKAPHVLCVCASCIRSIYRLICVYVLWDCFRWRFCVFCAGPFLFFLAI